MEQIPFAIVIKWKSVEKYLLFFKLICTAFIREMSTSTRYFWGIFSSVMTQESTNTAQCIVKQITD